MTSLHRRKFLKQSLAAAAAGVAISRTGLAFGQPVVGKSPNEKLSVALLGVRGRGQAHARAYAARQDCQITYICDADRQIGAAYAESLGKKIGRELKFVEDMRRIFEDKSVDIVVVTTPNHWHTLAGIWAMQAGKDVYVEKPVSHEISEGRRLFQVSRKTGRICQAGSQKRSVKANQDAAKYVTAGKLGKVTFAHLLTYRLRQPIGPPGSYPVPQSVNYDLWAGPAPMTPPGRQEFHYDWHWFWNYGNGEIGNNSVHQVDTMRQLLKLYGLGRSVTCYGGRVKFNDSGETPNTQIAIHDFGDLCVVQEVRNLKTDQPNFKKIGGTIRLVGSEGVLIGSGQTNTIYDPKGNVVTKFAETGGEDLGKVTVSKAGKHRDDFGNMDDWHIGNFIEAVRSRKREAQFADCLEGHFSAALCHLGNISYRLGKPVAPADILAKLKSMKQSENLIEIFGNIRQHLADNEVDIEKERLTLGPTLEINSDAEKFVGNPAADALLTREYRKPFVVPSAEEV